MPRSQGAEALQHVQLTGRFMYATLRRSVFKQCQGENIYVLKTGNNTQDLNHAISSHVQWTMDGIDEGGTLRPRPNHRPVTVILSPCTLRSSKFPCSKYRALCSRLSCKFNNAYADTMPRKQDQLSALQESHYPYVPAVSDESGACA